MERSSAVRFEDGEPYGWRRDGSARTGEFSVLVIADPEEFQTLRPEWAALVRRSSEHSVAQTFSYCWAGWRCVANAQHDVRLRIIVIERDRRLVGVWPLYVAHVGKTRIARHLGCGSNEEYAGPIIWQDEDADQVTKLALKTALALADVLEIYNIRADSTFARMIEASTRHHRQPIKSPVTALEGFDNGKAWVRSKSKSFRQNIRNARNRLGQLGPVEFALLPYDGAVAGFTDWLFDCKGSWLEARAINYSWINKPEGRDFFKSLLGLPDIPVRAAELTVGGKRIAGAIIFISGTVEYFVMCFDRAYAAYSPGQLLAEDLIGFAIDEHLDFDFRITTDAYKLRWVDRFEDRATYIVAATWRGLPRLVSEKRKAVVRSTRKRAGSALRALKRRVRR